jgi:SAM-dependent methyltransferase
MPDFAYVGQELDLFALATNWKRYFAALLGPYVKGTVLEVGAGRGETARALCNLTATRWVCVEPDARLARNLGEVVLPCGLRPEVIVGDLGAVPATERFDSIIYIDVLEHIERDARELELASSFLERGGHLVVLSPAYPALFSPFDEAIGHHRRYTRSTLAAAFPARLQRVALFHADSVGALVSFANRAVLRQPIPTVGQVLTWDRFVIPASRVLDPLLGRRFGRSVIAIYRASSIDNESSATSDNRTGKSEPL